MLRAPRFERHTVAPRIVLVGHVLVEELAGLEIHDLQTAGEMHIEHPQQEFERGTATAFDVTVARQILTMVRAPQFNPRDRGPSRIPRAAPRRP
jgi:hypothetical protein